MVQFSGFASLDLCIQSRIPSKLGGFPHSDIAGSKLYCQLPHAFRRLTRPSSPIIAKASTWCTYSLDSIISRTYWLCLLWGLTPLHLLKFLLWQSLLLLCVSHTPFVSFVWATSIQSPNIYFWFRVAAHPTPKWWWANVTKSVKLTLIDFGF